MSTALTLAFGWEPEIRGITTVLIIFLTLCGSTYLLLATNLGARLGLLVALAGLAGWMFLMGAIWWVYGIGLVGSRPTWQPVEVINDPSGLETAKIEEAADLSEWRSLTPDDPARGQAQAAADEILTVESKVFTAASEYLPVAVYDYGGGTWPEWGLNLFHDPHYSIVQVQAVQPQSTDAGQAAPTPVLDPDSPVVSVVMVRDLGDLRFPPAMLTLSSGIILFVLCNMLHRRDKALAKALAGGDEEPVTSRELDRV